MMEFNVNGADPGFPGFPAKRDPSALGGGAADPPPALTHSSRRPLLLLIPETSSDLPHLSRRTNCNPDRAREPGNLGPEQGGESRQPHPEPEQEVGGAWPLCLLLWW